MQDWNVPSNTWPKVFSGEGVRGTVSTTGSGVSGSFVGGHGIWGALFRPITLDRVGFNLFRLKGLAIYFSWESETLLFG
jgi:hypothetical protein